MPAQIPAVSKEYIKAPVAASVEIDAQTIEVAAITKGSFPDENTVWVDAEWIGDPNTTRTWRLLIGPGTEMTLTPGTYTIWVRITDVTEVPVRPQDDLKVV